MAKRNRKNPDMLFDTWNYRTLVLGLLLITAGFVAMYLENEVQGFISLFISPIVIMAGYVTIIIAIMKKHGNESESPGQTTG